MTERMTDEQIKDLAGWVGRYGVLHEPNGSEERNQLLDVSRAMMQLLEERRWRPIDTCPRHKEVLFWREDQGVLFGQYTYCAEWVTEEEQERHGYDEDTLWQEDPWVYLLDGVYRCEGDERPTHWRPLPAEPTPPQDGEA